MQVEAFDTAKLFVKSELIPVVVQDAEDLTVLMLGYANSEAVKLTMETGTAWFYSRSRQKLWNKGESSKNYLNVLDITADCDLDTLIYRCVPLGPTCHTGKRSCFYNLVWREGNE